MELIRAFYEPLCYLFEHLLALVSGGDNADSSN